MPERQLAVVHFCCWGALSSKSGPHLAHFQKKNKHVRILFNLVGTFIGLYWAILESTVRIAQKPLLWEHFQILSFWHLSFFSELAVVHFCCSGALSSKSGPHMCGFWCSLVETFIGLYWAILERTVRLAQKPLLWEHSPIFCLSGTCLFFTTEGH